MNGEKEYRNIIPTSTFGEEPEIWSQFYVSQSYNTFYVLYGCIETEKCSDDERILRRIKIELLSYKGPVNMGIHEDTRVTYNERDNIIVVDLYVQALNRNKSYCWSPCELVKLNINEFTTLLVRRRLVPVCKSMLKAGFFDWEHSYRDTPFEDFIAYQDYEDSKTVYGKDEERKYKHYSKEMVDFKNGENRAMRKSWDASKGTGGCPDSKGTILHI